MRTGFAPLHPILLGRLKLLRAGEQRNTGIAAEKPVVHTPDGAGSSTYWVGSRRGYS